MFNRPGKTDKSGTNEVKIVSSEGASDLISIRKVRRLKKKLEADISLLLNNFQRDTTGVLVSSLWTEATQKLDDINGKLVNQVAVTVEIDGLG